MHLSDLNKDIRRLLLDHWTEKEINERLGLDPEYFFEQVVIPHLDYLRHVGEDIPRLRFFRNPKGEPLVLLR